MNELPTQRKNGGETRTTTNLNSRSLQPPHGVSTGPKFQELWAFQTLDIVSPAMWPKHGNGAEKLLKQWPKTIKDGLNDIALLVKDVPWVRRKLEEQFEARQRAEDNEGAPWLITEDVQAVLSMAKALTPEERSQIGRSVNSSRPLEPAKRMATDPLHGPPGKRAKVEKDPPSSTKRMSISRNYRQHD